MPSEWWTPSGIRLNNEEEKLKGSNHTITLLDDDQDIRYFKAPEEFKGDEVVFIPKYVRDDNTTDEMIKDHHNQSVLDIKDKIAKHVPGGQ